MIEAPNCNKFHSLYTRKMAFKWTLAWLKTNTIFDKQPMWDEKFSKAINESWGILFFKGVHNGSFLQYKAIPVAKV